MSDVEVVNKAASAISGVASNEGFYTSLQLQSRADKMAMLRAINDSSPLLDAVGKEIAVVDVIMQAVEIANEQTGTIEDAARITLIDDKGEAYHATSKGIFQSLKQAFAVLGEPQTWQEPLVVKVLEEKGRNGFRYLTLKF